LKNLIHSFFPGINLLYSIEQFKFSVHLYKLEESKK